MKIGRLLAAFRGGDRGSTLIEVVVALTLMGGAFAVLLGIFGQSLGTAREGEQQLGARAIAQSLLRDGSDGEGVTQDGYRWRVHTTTVAPGGAGVSRLARVSVEVTWQSGWRVRHLSLATLKLAPGQAP